MKLIVGLGNPGEKYKNTRHNVGFILLDKFASHHEFPKWEMSSKLKAFVTKNSDFVLLKPQTLMNGSGYSVSAALAFFKIELDDLVVVHDDVDIEFGSLKIQTGRNSAGHRGVEDIIQKVGSNKFKRIRIGIGRPNRSGDVSDHVLSMFSTDELRYVDELKLEEYINKG